MQHPPGHADGPIVRSMREGAGIALGALAWRSGIPVRKLRSYEAGEVALSVVDTAHVTRALDALIAAG